ncbi:hypothetical protein D3C81_644440 [compost metagenome]
MQAPGNGVRPQIGRSAILERVEHDKHHGGVRHVDKAIDRKPREGNDAFNPGLCKRKRRHLLDDCFGAIQRGGVRQLSDCHQIVFVLHRHEARRHRLKAEVGQPQQPTVHHQRHPANPHHLAHGVAIGVGGVLERPAKCLQPASSASSRAMPIDGD